MSLADWAAFIKDVGFPIFAFILMYIMATKTIKDNTKAIREMIEIIKK